MVGDESAQVDINPFMRDTDPLWAPCCRARAPPFSRWGLWSRLAQSRLPRQGSRAHWVYPRASRSLRSAVQSWSSYQRTFRQFAHIHVRQFAIHEFRVNL
jgi:hypothetical protein